MNTLLRRLEDGKTIVDRIRESQEEKDVCRFVDDSYRRRSEYFEYLDLVHNGTSKITKVRKRYKDAVKHQHAQLTEIVTATKTCEIADDIISVAQGHSVPLAFTRAKRIKVNNIKKNPTAAQQVMATLAADGKPTPELIELVGMPARHFKLWELTQKGVIVRLNEKIPNTVEKEMGFIFQYQDEGYVVQAFMKKTLLKEFVISRQDIKLMEAARKTAVLPYGDNFLYVNCFRLRRLIAWLIAEGGL